jgi:hypothetical protein
LILTNAADGADPVIGDIFESSSGGNAVIGIALSGVIGVSADITYVTHVIPPFGENLKTYVFSIAFFLKKARTHDTEIVIVYIFIIIPEESCILENMR